MPTLIIGLIVAAVLFLAARKLYTDKKKGKSICAGRCSDCSGCCSCRSDCKR